ncbi:Prostaglandin reductase 1 [Bulinus truncatus]|nr:Prostaglandin reductase 1 [Bulinus truncatus]
METDGCKVIGSAGNQDKIDWLKSIGFDHVFNYKKTNVSEAIKEFAPDGIDCYFDNVGGEYALTVLDALRPYGRMCCCGQISRYNTTVAGPVKDIIHTVMINELSVSGIMVYSYRDSFASALQEMALWIKSGKLQVKETLFEGFTKLPEAFLEIFKGSSAGKLIVKA